MALGRTLAPLLVTLGLADQGFSTGMRRAAGETQRAAGSIDRSLRGVETAQRRLTRFSPFGNMVRGAGQARLAILSLQGAVIGLGGAALVRFGRSALDMADAMAKAADRAGVTVQAFSALSFGARLAGVEQDRFVGHLQMLNRTITQTPERLRSIGVAARDASGGFRGAAAVLIDVADRVAATTDRTEQARIAIAAFGRSGQDLLPYLRQGGQGIREMAEEAQRLGLVLDEETARRAERFNDQMSTLGRVIQANLQGGFLQGFTGQMGDLRSVFTDPAFIAGLRNAGIAIGQLSAFLVRNSREIVAAAAAFGTLALSVSVLGRAGAGAGALAGLAAGLGTYMAMSGDATAATDDLTDAFEEFRAAVGAFDAGGGAGGGGGASPLQQFREQIETARFELDLLRSGLSDIGQDTARQLRGSGVISGAEDLRQPGVAELAREYTELQIALRIYRAEADAVRQGEQRGQAVWEQTRTAAERYAATIAELQDLLSRGFIDEDTFARASQQADEALRRTRSGMDDLRIVGASLERTFNGVFDGLRRGALNFRDVLSGLIADLAQAVFQATVLRPLMSGIMGGVGGLFGFAGGGVMTAQGPAPLRRYATGGIARSPQLALFGEGSRPEAYVPLPDGRSIPVTLEGRSAGLALTINVDARGAGPGVAGDVRRAAEAAAQVVVDRLRRDPALRAQIA